MNPWPSISVIMPTYNRCDVTERSLRLFLAQDYPADRFELLVADNSSDDTPAMVLRLAEEAAWDGKAAVRLLASDERLPAVKRNRALEAATGELVVFMNDDVWVGPSFLAEHVASHRAHDEPIAVLGFIEQSREMPSEPFCDWFQPFSYYELAGLEDQAVPWRYFWSMNISLPRSEMLGRNLVFHEDWREIGEEDVELGYRWVQAGRRIIYNPRARGEHFHPHTLASAARVQESIGRGLRDVEMLIPERGLHERFGLFTWSNTPSAIVRGLARRMLFNAFTVPRIERWLAAHPQPSRSAQWVYWKVLLFYTNRGYRNTPRRDVQALRTGPPLTLEGSLQS